MNSMRYWQEMDRKLIHTFSTLPTLDVCWKRDGATKGSPASGISLGYTHHSREQE